MRRIVFPAALALAALLSGTLSMPEAFAAPSRATTARLKSLSPPTLGTLPTTTTANPVAVSGVAPSGTEEVRLYVNGQLLDLVLAAEIDAGGNFVVNVPLFDGSNSVHATAWDGTSESLPSTSQTTTYTNTLSTTQSGTIAAHTVWTPGAGPYRLAGDLTVAAGKTFRLMPGVRILVDGNFRLDVNGEFIAHGTNPTTQSIQIGSGQTSPASGQWKGVRIRSGGYADLDHVVIEHAQSGAIDFEAGQGVVRNSTFRTSTWGVRISKAASAQFLSGNRVHGNTRGFTVEVDDVGPQPRFTAGAIFDNDSTPGDNDTAIEGDASVVTVNGGSGQGVTLNFTGNWWGSSSPTGIAGSITDYSDNVFGARPAVDFSGYLASDGGSPAYAGGGLAGLITNRTLVAGSYQVLGNIQVAAGQTLTLSPGAIVEAPGTYRINVHGNLSASGTSANPVTFRSGRTTPAKGDWEGITVHAGATVDLDYVVVEHAKAGAINFDGGNGEVTNSIFRASNDGVRVGNGSAPQFPSGNRIVNNDYGVRIFGETANPVIVQGEICGNGGTGNGNPNASERGIWLSGYSVGGPVQTLDARGNWWCSADATQIAATIRDFRNYPTMPYVQIHEFRGSGMATTAPLVAFETTFHQRKADSYRQVTASGGFVLNTTADVDLEIFRYGQSTPVRTMDLGTRASGAISFTWDGKDDGGSPVDAGTYRLVTKLARSLDTWVDDPPASTDLTDGGVSADEEFHPYRNEHAKFDFGRVMPSVVQFTYYQGTSTDPVLPRGPEIIDAGGEWLHWDGRDPSGALVSTDTYYRIRIPVLRNLEPYYLEVPSASPLITGLLDAPMIEVHTNPWLVVQSYEQISRLAFRVDLDSYVVVKLLPPGIVDPASSQAMVLMAEQLLLAEQPNGSPADHFIEWQPHGATDSNRMKLLQEGAYTFTIEARSAASNQSSIYRGVLNVAR
jgi:hypothetical protein